MGTVVPDTFRASNKISNKNHLLHLVGIWFPHINDDARSKPHQKTWLLPKLPAEGQLPKLVQRATPVTGCWVLGWRMKKVLVRRNWFGTEQEVQTETTTNLIRHSRRFGRQSSCKLQAPQPPANSQSTATSHIRTSVRSLSPTVGSQTLYHWGGNERRNVLTNCLERRSSGSNLQRWAEKIMILHG
jgi:hypothetical protein